MEGKHEAARATQKREKYTGTGKTALKVLATLQANRDCTAFL